MEALILERIKIKTSFPRASFAIYIFCGFSSPKLWLAAVSVKSIKIFEIETSYTKELSLNRAYDATFVRNS